MPSVSQQDYIYIEVGEDMSPSMWSSEVKKQIAKAIDNGVGLDVVLRERIGTAQQFVDSRILCARCQYDDSYYVAFWNYAENEMSFVEFDPEEA